MLDHQTMRKFLESEHNSGIQCNTPTISDEGSETNLLARKPQGKLKHISPIKIIPDKLTMTFEDKTSVPMNKRMQVARLELMKKEPEPSGTLKPFWNIIPDGTITEYTPNTISTDTHIRENTRIRKIDLATATETYQKPIPLQRQEPMPQLMQFVACKTVRKFNRNREKIRKFCLDEKWQIQRNQ